MKLSSLSLASLASMVAAQAPPGNFPTCGQSVLFPAISASGCGFTNSTCLCGNAGYKEAVTKKLVGACTSPADLQTFSSFVNDMCKGQPGFPVTIGKAEAASSSTPSGSAVSATQVSDTIVPSASGTAPRPAVSTGAASRNTLMSQISTMAFIMMASIGVRHM